MHRDVPSVLVHVWLRPRVGAPEVELHAGNIRPFVLHLGWRVFSVREFKRVGRRSEYSISAVCRRAKTNKMPRGSSDPQKINKKTMSRALLPTRPTHFGRPTIKGASVTFKPTSAASPGYLQAPIIFKTKLVSLVRTSIELCAVGTLSKEVVREDILRWCAGTA